MVGFGSSLRMSRRPGWEMAYLDYETLKLLLSQIEAVYEEEGHRRRARQDAAMQQSQRNSNDGNTNIHNSNTLAGGGGGGGGGGNHRTKHDDITLGGASSSSLHGKNNNNNKLRDYREELFLEWDSDAAYASVEDGLDEEGNLKASAVAVGGGGTAAGGGFDGGALPYGQGTAKSATHTSNKPLFLRSYSHHAGDDGSSSEEGGEDASGRQSGCGMTVPSLSFLRTTNASSNATTSTGGVSSSSGTTTAGMTSTGISNNSRTEATGSIYGGSAASGGGGGGSSSNNALTFGDISAAVDSSKRNKNKRWNPHHHHPSSSHHPHKTLSSWGEEEEDAFYMQSSTNMHTINNAFYMAGGGEDSEGQEQDDDGTSKKVNSSNRNSSILNAPVMRTHESTSLLATPVHPTSSMLYSFAPAGASSPPRPVMYTRSFNEGGMQQLPEHVFLGGGGASGSTGDSPNATPLRPNHVTHLNSGSIGSLPSPPASVGGTNRRNGSNDSSRNAQGPASKSGGGAFVDNPALQHERRQRRQRRKRLRALRKARAARERKVPRHLRVAHAKARAFTERFLGLLRAETEKVLLFAQSRLGELADTVGSLRFPTYDDPHDVVPASHGSNHHMSNGSDRFERLISPNSFDYPPLSDGGLHPSASSSESEGGAHPHGKNAFAWSDSSDDDTRDGHPSMSNKTTSNVFSAGVAAEEAPRKMHGGSSAFHHRPVPTKASARTGGAGSTLMEPPMQSRHSMEEKARAAVQRQIDHFTALRQRRPIFLRNDQILGEDLLLISAVEEADGYTAVAVELIHILRYICVNLIAVRKICRKHDRLLMNRMVGGYYHRTRAHQNNHAGGNNTGTSQDRLSHMEDAQTLGGRLAKIAQDRYDAHPALIGSMSHYKLVGVYDRKIQKLANSRTVQVISSCLALALSESEVARSRANALTKLNSVPSPLSHFKNQAHGQGAAAHQDACSEDALSTASSISLTRLQFTVTSIFALREAARFKLDHYGAYLARSMLTFTGRPVVGEGLDGCSRETLDFLVAYNPDSALLHDTAILFHGLRHGRWKKLPIADVMLSTLTVAAIPVTHMSMQTASAWLVSEEKIISNAISVAPKPKDFLKRLQWPWAQRGDVVQRQAIVAPELPPCALTVNSMHCFLFMMNYFVAHATSNEFVKDSGRPEAFSSMVIGAPNFSAIIISMLHCFLMSRMHIVPHRFPPQSTDLLRRLFAFSAVAGLLGNIVHAVAVNRESVPMAFWGRFMVGFSSCEILHRQVITACQPSHVVAQASSLVQMRIFGMIVGLLVGSLAETIHTTFARIGIRSMQSTSWLMGLLWLAHIVHLLVQFRGPRDAFQQHGDERQKEQDEEDGSARPSIAALPSGSHDDDVDSSDSDHITTPMLYRSNSETTSEDPFQDAYGGGDGKSHTNSDTRNIPSENSPLKTKEKQKGGFRQFMTFASRIFKLLRYHIGIPLVLYTIVYANFALEVFFTSAPFMTDRYFQWSGEHACLLLSFLAVLILPISMVCEFVSRRYEERTVLRRSVFLIIAGLIFMINWVSMFSLAKRAPILLEEREGTAQPRSYDWRFGIVQYLIGIIVTFVGLVGLEGAALSLLSKLAPLRLRSVVINMGSIVVFLGFMARILGDSQLYFVGLSHRIINADILNAVVIPLLLFSLPIIFSVNRRFFFLM